MASYEIQAVAGQPRDWNSSQGGPMKEYRIDLKDDAGAVIQNVEWSRKVSSPAPEVGQKLDGTISEGNFGPKFKQAAAGGGGGGGRFRDPVEDAKTRRSIQMQHAQKAAVEALRVAAEFGDYKPPSASDVVGQIKTIAAGLFQQIEDVAA